MDGGLIIDSEQKFNSVDMTYVRQPVFGKNSDDLIVDIMNPKVVDILMQKTCNSLRYTSSDSDAQAIDELTERQGQKIK